MNPQFAFLNIIIVTSIKLAGAQSCILALLPALAVAITHLLMIIRKVSETDGNNGELAY